MVRYAVLCVALTLVAVAGAADPAWARSLQVGVDDDGVLLGGFCVAAAWMLCGLAAAGYPRPT